MKVSLEELLIRLKEDEIEKFSINNIIYRRQSKKESADAEVISLINVLFNYHNLDYTTLKLILNSLKRHQSNSDLNVYLVSYIRMVIKDFENKLNRNRKKIEVEMEK